jgi:hypothetical protein
MVTDYKGWGTWGWDNTDTLDKPSRPCWANKAPRHLIEKMAGDTKNSMDVRATTRFWMEDEVKLCAVVVVAKPTCADHIFGAVTNPKSSFEENPLTWWVQNGTAPFLIHTDDSDDHQFRFTVSCPTALPETIKQSSQSPLIHDSVFWPSALKFMATTSPRDVWEKVSRSPFNFGG